MSNQSLFVKIVIWFMVFLMSVGFAALVVTPFMSGSLFGGDNGRSATEELRDDARADIRDLNCGAEKVAAKNVDDCREAYSSLGSAYTTLAYPADETATELPKDSKRNLDRAQDAYKLAYELDTKNNDAAERYASFLRDQGESEKAVTLWAELVKREPKNEGYLLQLAEGQAQTNKLDLAIETYTGFLKKFPDSGQLTSIEERIAELKTQKADQAKQAAAGAAGGLPGGAGGDLPISVN